MIILNTPNLILIILILGNKEVSNPGYLLIFCFSFIKILYHLINFYLICNRLPNNQMRRYFLNTLCITLLFCSSLFAQTPGQWKKAVVKIESVQQRYSPDQLDILLQKKLDSIGHVISQHETADIRGELAAIKDTLRGTGLLIADGAKIYLITAKHLIKATELSNGLETLTDQLTIRTDATEKQTNTISLLSLTTGLSKFKPFVLSGDKNDLGIISFQKNDYKSTVAYLKQIGVIPVPVEVMVNTDDVRTGDEVFTVGFPALRGSKRAEAANGKVTAVTKTTSNFTVALAVYPGNSGGPVIKNNKLVGILSYPSGIATNVDAALHPFAKANAAAATNASVILPLLRKLQANERNPTFNR